MTPTPPSTVQRADPVRAFRDRLLDAMLDEAAFSGWTRAGVEAARAAAGLEAGEALLAAPRGGVDLIDAWFDRAETAMERALADCEPGMKIRARATLAVRARIEAMASHKEAARRAVIALAMPTNAADAARIGWRAGDRAWAAMGDTSTDLNWYTKRAILAGVHAATFAYWLQDDSLDAAPTWAFLDRRIADVMRIEGVKAHARKLAERLPDPLGLLTRLRFGASPRP